MLATKSLSADNKINKMFLIARTIAILTFISAHTTIKSSVLIANLYSAIGSIGVVLFFIMSGYYYKKYPLLTLLKKKGLSVILPWVVIGSTVYVVNSILTSNVFAIDDLLLWLVGYKTYLYYVVILLVCFIIFYFHNTATLLIAIILNAISIFLTSLNIMDPIINLAYYELFKYF